MNKMTTSRVKTFMLNEDGSATPLAIGFSVIFIVLGGLAVDYNKAVGERTQMQMAADSAAHAAAYTWEFQDTTESTKVALTTIEGMLPDVAFANALQDQDIEYGFWDADLGSFTLDPTFVEDRNSPMRSAVRASAQLEPSRLNESRNIFLSIIGQDTFTIRTQAVYASYYPPCFNEGFVAEDIVDLQSNNSYTDGFCIHSNTYVSINQNNYFEPGTVVSMPNLDDLDIPASGFKKNDGLQTALRQGEYRMRLLGQLPMMFDSLRDGNPKYANVAGIAGVLDVLYPLDLSGGGGGSTTSDTSGEKVTGKDKKNTTTTEETTPEPTPEVDPNGPRMNASDSGKKNMTAAHFQPANRVFRLECSGNGDITFAAETFSDFALITDCPIQFANGTVLDGVLIATEGDVNASHVQLGLDDNCAPGGGASIWTYGDVKTASALSGYGAQILAMGDIQFTANADGIEGVSFISGGRIDGTSNSTMGFCEGDGTSEFVAAPYFRMVN